MTESAALAVEFHFPNFVFEHWIPSSRNSVTPKKMITDHLIVGLHEASPARYPLWRPIHSLAKPPHKV
jgi:hypothetical protein